MQQAKLRHDWQKAEIVALSELPFMELLYQAQSVHRQYFDPNEVQNCQLLSIKTGTCPEDCGYCSQSGHHSTKIEKQKLLSVEQVVKKAKQAKENGASRFCMGGAWRGPREKEFPQLLEMIKEVKALGLESCATFGMLTDQQAEQLAEGGLDYYNHNLDTSEEYYPKITGTRTYQDRLDTLDRVRKSGVKVCCGGILGLGEQQTDRAGLLMQLANMPEHPQSVPINMLVAVEGTPLGNQKQIDPIELVRWIAVARIMMPHSFVRLSAGRSKLSTEAQALCFFAGANSIFIGDVLLTTENNEITQDQALFEKLDIKPLDLKAFYQQREEATC